MSSTANSSTAAPPTTTAASEPNVKPRLPAYKACENCRLRKIKCTGEIPCKACTAAEIGETCQVRVKAKPNRAPGKVPKPQKYASPDLANQAIHSGSTALDGAIDGRVSPEPPFFPVLAQTEPPTYRFEYDDVPTASVSPQTAAAGGSAGGYSGDAFLGVAAAQSVSPASAVGPGNSGGIAGQTGDARNPLVGIERALAEWCIRNDVPLQPLLFHDEPRIALMPSPPLPAGPAIIAFEDELMCCLLSAEDRDNLQAVDSPRLLNLYSRYRALPLTLTDDQTALIYASLCIARYTQLRAGVAAAIREPKTARREDVTYYRMARAALTSWGRASITGMWALFGLTVWVQLHGSAAEHAEVLGSWAWQIQGLGLHRRATAQLYPAQDMSERLLAAYSNGETLRAIMTDLKPAIPVAEIEVEAALGHTGLMANLTRASNYTLKYLRDYADPLVDVTNVGYLAAAEEAWSVELDGSRAQQEIGLAKVIVGWAQMRIHWLRILLHFPRVRSSPGRAAQATIYVLRSVAHILNIHTDAAAINKLDPSWPQLKRIMVCGQALVICVARGECHHLEALDLFGKLAALLQAHVDFWPGVAQAILGYRDAAARLGIILPLPATPDPDPPAPVSALDFETYRFDADMMGADLFLDMDFGSTFATDWPAGPA